MTETVLERIGTHGLGVLVTIKRDGRPQLSNVTYVFDGTRVRVSLTDDRAKTRNLRRDPRASLYIDGPRGRSYLVLEGKAELSPVAAEPNDAVVDDLVDYYRTASGEHPDWDDYRAAMVRDRRLVFSMTIDHAYGMPGAALR
ncbi:PPOX class F420-dependent oxidoreductase [Kribbella solani]|uniref:PPOX class F420-dependent oxidoreductase n=1 Tax=Kribbella solani TaxID=236067 RepID=UPI0029BEF822|nr:PPOX class F420-dependent oxidoreductase [Kribbella solani]MDX2972266.1 PPOX class F420-dependent oxidoreductase [Kribbella solani]